MGSVCGGLSSDRAPGRVDGPRERVLSVVARVLVVEDDESLQEIAGIVLEAGGFEVEKSGDGLDALHRFDRGDFSLIVLDLMLPGLDGLSVCREIRKKSQVPIVILTARRETPDVVAGLELGADDYLTKPFEAPELLARVRAVLRRTLPEANGQMTFVIDTGAFRAFKGDEELTLSATEFKLLTELASHRGQVLTREQLVRRVWGYDYLGDSRLVDMAIKRLRDKIESDPDESHYIVTVRGVGYRFEPPQ